MPESLQKEMKKAKSFSFVDILQDQIKRERELATNLRQRIQELLDVISELREEKAELLEQQMEYAMPSNMEMKKDAKKETPAQTNT